MNRRDLATSLSENRGGGLSQRIISVVCREFTGPLTSIRRSISEHRARPNEQCLTEGEGRRKACIGEYRANGRHIGVLSDWSVTSDFGRRQRSGALERLA